MNIFFAIDVIYPPRATPRTQMLGFLGRFDGVGSKDFDAGSSWQILPRDSIDVVPLDDTEDMGYIHILHLYTIDILHMYITHILYT